MTYRTAARGLTRRRTLLATSAAAAAAILSGCDDPKGGPEATSGPVTIRFAWWGNDEQATATQNAVALFERRNPSIKVLTEFSAYDAYYQKLSTRIAGKTAPDLLQIDRPYLREYASRGALLDLGWHLKGTMVEQIPRPLLDSGTLDAGGALYAVPAGQLTQMLVYDPAKFAQAGVVVPAGQWTWARFADDMARVAAATGTPGTTDFGWAIDWFEVWLHQRERTLYTERGMLGFTTDDLIAFWTMTSQMRARKAVSTPQATAKMDGAVANSALVTAQSASEINYDSSLPGYLGSYGGPLRATAVPSDGPGTGMALMASVGFAIAQRTAHPAATVRLLDFLLNDPDAGELLAATRGVPAGMDARAHVCASPYTGNSSTICGYEDSVYKLVGPPFAPWPKGSATVKRDFQTVYLDVIFDRITVAEGANRLVTSATATLVR